MYQTGVCLYNTAWQTDFISDVDFNGVVFQCAGSTHPIRPPKPIPLHKICVHFSGVHSANLSFPMHKEDLQTNNKQTNMSCEIGREYIAYPREDHSLAWWFKHGCFDGSSLVLRYGGRQHEASSGLQHVGLLCAVVVAPRNQVGHIHITK